MRECFKTQHESKIIIQNMHGFQSLQVVGSIVGVKLLIDTIPEVGLGPRLNVDIHRGALTEGLLTFAIVTISLGLATKIRENFFMKTWISSLSKLTLHILGSDLTGGCMNPASVSIAIEETIDQRNFGYVNHIIEEEEESTYIKSNSFRIIPHLHHSFSWNLTDKINDLLEPLDFK